MVRSSVTQAASSRATPPVVLDQCRTKPDLQISSPTGQTTIGDWDMHQSFASREPPYGPPDGPPYGSHPPGMLRRNRSHPAACSGERARMGDWVCCGLWLKLVGTGRSLGHKHAHSLHPRSPHPPSARLLDCSNRRRGEAKPHGPARFPQKSTGPSTITGNNGTAPKPDRFWDHDREALYCWWS